MQTMKNAIVYKVQLPTAEQLRQHFDEAEGFKHTPITEAAMRSDGFVPHSVTGDLVADFSDGTILSSITGEPERATGGYILTLRSDEKVIPNDAVKQVVDEEIAGYENAHGEAPEKEQVAIIKESVLQDLCSKALSRTHFTTALYHEESGLLFINTTTPGKADRMLGLLIELVGSVESKTIHISGIKHGLTRRLEILIEQSEEAPFGTMQVDDCVKLKRKMGSEEPTEKIAYTGSDLSFNEELLEQLRRHFEVEELGLWHPAGASFRLNHQFRLKSIYLAPFDPADDGSDDPAYVYRMQALQDSFSMVAVVNDLCDLLGYEPPSEEDAEEPEAATEGTTNE